MGTLLIIVLAAMYFIPTIIGWSRGISNRIWLVLINLLFGWTVVGWIVCMIWAVAGATKAQDRFYREQMRNMPR